MDRRLTSRRRSAYVSGAMLSAAVLVMAGLVLLSNWRSCANDTHGRAEHGREGLPPAITTRISGFARVRYDAAGQKVAVLHAKVAALVAPKIGPFRFGPLNVVEAVDFDVQMFGDDYGAIGLAAGEQFTGRRTTKPVIGIEARGFRLALHSAQGQPICTVRSGRASWSFRQKGTQQIELSDGVVVEAPGGRELAATTMKLELPSRRIVARGEVTMVVGRTVRNLPSFKGTCDLPPSAAYEDSISVR